MFDIEVIETGEEGGGGGDLLMRGKDLAVVYGWENFPYLAMFGGNKEGVTRPRNANEQAVDYWANSLLWPDKPELQFNSLTEAALHSLNLTSGNRLLIEDAIKQDLAFMKPFADVTVTTVIIATDVIEIGIKVKQPDNLQEKQFIFIWDAFKGLKGKYYPNPNYPKQQQALQYTLGFSL